MKNRIDLNCDLGEWRTEHGPALDMAIMPYISSCNIACGGHIGDDYSMKKTIDLAQKHEVKIGAHPSFPDRAGFGRRLLKIEDLQLQDILIAQIQRLQTLLKSSGADLHHIKPHGALYNEAAKNTDLAKIIIQAVLQLQTKPKIYGLFNSELEKVAKNYGLEFYAEGFADRVYEDDLSLRSRKLEGSILHGKEEVIHQIFAMVTEQKVETYSGKEVQIIVDTICLHSDTPGSEKLAKYIYQFLIKNGVKVVSV